jgi:hypothetical protein
MCYDEPVIRAILAQFDTREESSFAVIPTETLEWLAELAKVPPAEIPNIRIDISHDRQD